MADQQDSEDDEKGKRHPKTSYNAKYPYNQVRRSESGHEYDTDDTPGNTRIREAHRSGSYYEISHKGRYTQMVVDNHHHYVKGGHTHTVDKNFDSKVHGSSRQNIGGHDHKEVKGDQTRAIGKDNKTTVGGDSTSSVKGDHVHGVVGEIHMKAGKKVEFKGDNELDMKIDAKALMEFGDTLTIRAVTKITLQCGGSTIVMVPDQITVHSQTIVTESGGDTKINAGGDIVEDAGGGVHMLAGADITTRGAKTIVQVGGQQVTPTSDIFI